jgi:hypothetical protein
VPRKVFIPVVLALGALVAALPAGGAGSETYNDPNGDGGAGPDIVSVVVSNDDTGVITFAVSYSNRPTLVGDDIVDIYLDTDRNAATGDHGADYRIRYRRETQRADLGRWDGGAFDENVPQGSLSTTDGKTISVGYADLGGTLGFDFRVVTSSYSLQAGDTAPEGGGVWAYNVQLKAAIKSILTSFAPAAPVAGKYFAVRRTLLRLSTNEQVAPSSVTCAAKIGAKKLKLHGRCRWLIPKKAKGKKLAVTMTALYGGERAVFTPYKFKIR